MTGHYFISYSSVDGADFALRLCDALIAGPPSIPAWLDKRELRPGEDWDEQIVEAIRACEGLLFVMTRDSVEPQSVCKNEWTRALKYKKPIVPIRLHRAAEMPFRLGVRQHIDFSGEFEPALARLRTHLGWLASPEGVLHALKDRLADAERDLRRAQDDVEEARIRDDIKELKRRIAEQQHVVDDPEGVAERVEESIARGLERERQPERPVRGITSTRFINPPPGVAPPYFQDRYVETGLIGDFLKNDAQRMMTVVGRAGIGKTAMVCRLLKALEGGKLPDDAGPLSVDGIVYLSATGSRHISVPNLYADLSSLLPEDTAQELDILYRDPQVSTEAKIQALLAAFPRGRTVLLLDNFEDVIDPETRNVRDTELDEALRAILNAPQHGIKVILTTRVAPLDLALVQPGRQARLDLDEGLASPYAENILREMDVDGKVGLESAPDAELDEARQRTRGNPRALEALFAILSADRNTTLPEILADAERLLPDNVVDALVGEAFNRLDPADQMVMQALAIYGRPVAPVAVDYLLEPHLPGVDSAPALNRLVNMHFARREAGRYYLHPVDRAYALSRVPRGEVSDREDWSDDFVWIEDIDDVFDTEEFEPLLDEESLAMLSSLEEVEAPPFTQYALLDRGADYFSQARLPRESWKTLEDLAPQLAEFELRCAGQDYDTAANVLLEIDFDYLLLWGEYRLVAELHERLRDRLDDVDLGQANAGNLGTAYYRLGRVHEAVLLYEQARSMAREIGDWAGEGIWIGNLGACYSTLGQTERAIEHYQQALSDIYARLGQTERAIEHFQQALDIAREVGDRSAEGSWLGSLGDTYDTLGQTERAIEHYQQALDIARQVGDRSGEGSWLGSLGDTYDTLGQTERAMEHYQQALDIAREIGDRSAEGAWLGSLGRTYATLGQTEQAMEHYQEALDIAREVGVRSSEGAWLGSLGDTYATLGQTERAIEHYQQALDIAREVSNRSGEGAWLGSLGDTYARLGQTERAIEQYQQALDIAREVGNRSAEGSWLGSLGDIYARLGQTERAIEHYQQALGIAREVSNRSAEGAWLGSLGDTYDTLGQTERAIEHFQQALDIAREVGARSSEGSWLGSLGDTYVTLGQIEQAIEHYQQALDIAREIGNRSAEGAWLGSLGDTYARLGQTERAIEHYQQALDIARETGNRSGEGSRLGSLGDTYAVLGQTERAIEHYQQALDIARQVGDRSGEGTWLGSLGDTYATLGQTEQAMEHYQQALDIAREVGNRSGEGAWLGSLGDTYATLGQTERAIEHYQQALDIAREIGDRSAEGAWLGSLGQTYATLGQAEQAIEHYQQALDIAREVGNRSGEATWLNSLGNSYSDLGQTARAIEHFEQALDIAREIGGRSGEGAYLGNLGNCYSNLGQTPHAVEHYEQALDIAREIGDRSSEGIWLGNLGNCYGDLGQTARAVEHYKQAVDIAREIGERSSEGTYLGNLGICYGDLGQTADAVEHFEQALDIAREIGERSTEGNWLSNLAEVMTDEGRYEDAIHYARQGASIGAEISSPTLGSYNNGNLALARLYTDDLSAARAAAEVACQHDEPQHNHYALALLGLIALRQGDQQAAGSAFSSAVTRAEAMLAQSEQNYKALDAKGLALCGLALLEKDPKGLEDLWGLAIEAYRAARAINQDAGEVGRVLRLLDALALADLAGGEMLAEARGAAGGEGH
jgi:tetratricopeptide (TPR) repeat protein